MSDALTIYKVVIDRESQYSVWPLDKDLPPGWLETGMTGTEKECLHFINENAPQIKYAKTKVSGKK
jgi:MbtH protein